ncbi:TPA: hypothetical protein DIT45_03255 [Candidatus Acetothermia bacterium]|nr:hypothetical protein [Candidatus Acetothermia bacterium]
MLQNRLALSRSSPFGYHHPRGGKVQPLEAWIHANVALERVDSAHLRYNAIDHQAPQDLLGVYRAYDPERIYDWVDLTLIFAYLNALSTIGRILDIGTGDGWPALPLAPHVREVIGVDLSSVRVEVARENLARFGYTNITFTIASGEDLPFSSNSFDGVVVGTAIEQMNDPRRCLAEIYRVLVPGGALIATVEHLGAELSEEVSEQVEFFKRGNGFLYRYTVKEALPSREAEYQLFLHSSNDYSELLNEKAVSFPSRLGFVRRAGEPGARALADDIKKAYGLSFLKEIAEMIDQGQYFELDHFDLLTLKETLEAVGFSEVKICGRITQAAHRFFIDLNERGTLKGLHSHFESICAALATLWPLIPPQDESVLFIRSRRGK